LANKVKIDLQKSYKEQITKMAYFPEKGNLKLEIVCRIKQFQVIKNILANHNHIFMVYFPAKREGASTLISKTRPKVIATQHIFR
jgi:hypothetical protein